MYIDERPKPTTINLLSKKKKKNFVFISFHEFYIILNEAPINIALCLNELKYFKLSDSS